MLGVSSARPLSMATNVSVELSGYQRALEDVLTWLLEAEDRLTNAPATEGPLHQIKDQFHIHEVRCSTTKFLGLIILIFDNHSSFLFYFSSSSGVSFGAGSPSECCKVCA